MKTNRQFHALFVVVLLMAFTFILPGFAADSPPVPTTEQNVLERGYVSLKKAATPSTGGLISARELTLSIAPSYTAPQRGLHHLFDTSIRRGVYGLNGAADYYPVKNIGVGVEAGVTDWNDPGSLLIDYGAISITARAQVWALIPSVSAGFGRDFRQGQCYTQLRPGIAVAFNSNVRLFTSGAYRWSENERDSLLLLTGLQVAFR